LVTKLATFAISASKRSGQLVNENFICSENITPNPGYLKGWIILKMTAVAHGANIFSITHTQGSEGPLRRNFLILIFI